MFMSHNFVVAERMHQDDPYSSSLRPAPDILHRPNLTAEQYEMLEKSRKATQSGGFGWFQSRPAGQSMERAAVVVLDNRATQIAMLESSISTLKMDGLVTLGKLQQLGEPGSALPQYLPLKILSENPLGSSIDKSISSPS